MTEIIGQINKLNRLDLTKCEIEFWVAPKEEFTAYMLNDLSKEDMHIFTYKMVVAYEKEGEFTMDPDEALAECLDVLHQYEFCENLNASLRRKWKTGKIADDITQNFIESRIKGFWDSEEE